MSLNENDPTDENVADSEILIVSETTILQAESELSEISDLVGQNISLLGGEDVAELLQRLASADNMAQGMEAKLDNVLGNLDKILAMLGAEKDSEEQAEGSDKVKNSESAEEPVQESRTDDPVEDSEKA